MARPPRLAGTVEAVGPHVAALKPGDEVYGQVPGGAFAEYVCAPADLFAPKPANLSFDPREDFARDPERYDVMLDLVGNRPLADCRAVLKPGA